VLLTLSLALTLAGMYAQAMNTRTGTTRATRSRQPVKRIVLTTRILPATDTRLTAAAQKTGNGPQDLVEAALNRYFDELGIPAADQLDQGES
jgi:hypothetical protein